MPLLHPTDLLVLHAVVTAFAAAVLQTGCVGLCYGIFPAARCSSLRVLSCSSQLVVVFPVKSVLKYRILGNW